MLIPNAIYVADSENSHPPFAYFTRTEREGDLDTDAVAVEVKPLLLQAVLGHTMAFGNYQHRAGWVTPNCWTNINLAKYLLTTPKLMVVDIEESRFRDDRQTAVLALWEDQGSMLLDNPFYIGELDENLSGLQ